MPTLFSLLGIFTGSGLIAFLVTALVIAVVIYVIILILNELGVTGTIRKLIMILMAVIAIVYLVNRFAGINI